MVKWSALEASLLALVQDSICKNDVRARRLCRFAYVSTCLSGLEAGSMYAIAASSSTTPTVSGQTIMASLAVISVVTSLALDLRQRRSQDRDGAYRISTRNIDSLDGTRARVKGIMTVHLVVVS